MISRKILSGQTKQTCDQSITLPLLIFHLYVSRHTPAAHLFKSSVHDPYLVFGKACLLTKLLQFDGGSFHLGCVWGRKERV